MLAVDLFPSSPPVNWEVGPLPAPHGDTSLYTKVKLASSARCLPSGKAPVRYEALALLCVKCPDLPLAVFNGCLATGRSWMYRRLPA